MPDQHQLEFFLLRYVPDAVSNEFVNIGVVLLQQGQEAGYAGVRFTRDWRRVRCLDPDADLPMFEALERELRTRLADVHDRAELLRRLQESFSNTIQLSSTTACIAEEPQQEIETLARMYLEMPWRAGHRQVSRRGRMVRALRNSFQQAGLEKFIEEQIRVAEFTHVGDPLRIDFGYRLKGMLKMFHATPLSATIDTAKVLAFTYPQFAGGLRRARGIASELTAIVEDKLDRTDDRISFAMTTMEKSGIQIAVEAEIPLLAENARVELQA